ncbi:MAG TPA: protein translocase subunit SecD [Terriglobales bacterium]|nr:protein translocase subunit SecD [Terriglobales bacterium]
MNKNLGWKLILIIAAILVFVYGVFGVPSGVSGGALANGLLNPSPMRNGIHLGLDLKGGTHLILQVQVNDAVNVDTDNALQVLKSGLKNAKVASADVSKPDPTNHPEQIVIKGVPPESAADLRTIVEDRLPEYSLVSSANNTFTVTMKPTNLADLKSRAVQQAIETIRNRIDQLGVSEPIIEEHGLGDYQILVQLPGIDDPARVKEIIQSTAMLEIRQVFSGPYASQEDAYKSGALPEDAVVMPGKNNPDGSPTFYVVSRIPAVSGKDLRTAGPGTDENGRPAVSFTLTAEGGRKFYAFTSEHVKDLLGVVLDGKVQSVATIDEPIRDQGIIKGRFTDQEVKDQAMILRSGALPAGIKYLEERTVGPSLGSDSIHAGIRAAVVGMAAVLIFMLIYYRAAGINADIALILNLVILLGFLGYTGATLTLPGIAGVILTVGMGVDSNVLIFERIREELRNGKTPPSAVEQGFAHAWVTIVDTHVTTIVSAIILFLFGTGPVKGFAVTLSFGLFANLFTAVFVSRVIFDWVLSRKRIGEALSI